MWLVVLAYGELLQFVKEKHFTSTYLLFRCAHCNYMLIPCITLLLSSFYHNLIISNTYPAVMKTQHRACDIERLKVLCPKCCVHMATLSGIQAYLKKSPTFSLFPLTSSRSSLSSSASTTISVLCNISSCLILISSVSHPPFIRLEHSNAASHLHLCSFCQRPGFDPRHRDFLAVSIAHVL